MSARQTSLKELIFAAGATTTIPTVPQAGIPYRDEGFTPSEAANGWPYYRIVNSAEFNEIMFRMTGLLDEIEKTGILKWSQSTNYPISGICRDPDDGLFYEALQASGPDEGGYKQPSLNIGTYWTKTLLSGVDGYAVQWVSSNVAAEVGRLLYCTTGSLIITLPTVDLVDGNKVKVSTGALVSSSNTVTISGAIEGEATFVLDAPHEVIEFIYNEADAEWKMSGKQISGGTGEVTIISSGGSGTKGWRKYSDGRMEQWGVFTSATTYSNTSVTFPQAFGDTSTSIVMTPFFNGKTNGDENTGSGWWISALTTTGFNARIAMNVSGLVSWYASGISA